jgi:hypothetical protein
MCIVSPELPPRSVPRQNALHKLICRKFASPLSPILPVAPASGAREGIMSTAGNALLWTAGFFALSFVAIFVVYIADRMRQNLTGKP